MEATTITRRINFTRMRRIISESRREDRYFLFKIKRNNALPDMIRYVSVRTCYSYRNVGYRARTLPTVLVPLCPVNNRLKQ